MVISMIWRIPSSLTYPAFHHSLHVSKPLASSIANVTGALIDKEGRWSGLGNQKEKNAKDVALYAWAPKSIRCFNCGKMGHMAWNCCNPKKDDKKDSANAVYTVFDEDDGTRWWYFFGFPEEFPDECLVSRRVPDEVFGTMYFWVAPDDMFYICLFFLIGVHEILPVAWGSVRIWQLGQYLRR